MSEPQTIGEILARQSLLSADSMCEKCRIRYKFENSKWCGRCRDVWHNRERLTPERINHEVMNKVGERYSHATLNDLDKKLIEKLINVEDDSGIFLYGPVGVGKTYTMAALLRYYVGEGYDCRRINFDDFCVEVRSTFSVASKETAYSLIEKLTVVDKLFVDDLGLRSELESQFAYLTFYSLLNKRLEKMLPTLICSNKTIEQLGQTFDARIASRLQTFEVIKMDGKDRRKRK